MTVHKYLTPDEVPEDTICRPLLIPNNTMWLGAVNGALLMLTDEANWEQSDVGDMTPAAAAAAAWDMITAFWNVDCCDNPPPASWCKFFDFTIDRYLEVFTRTGGFWEAGIGYRGLSGEAVRLTTLNFWDSVTAIEIKFWFSGTGTGNAVNTDITEIGNVSGLSGAGVTQTITRIVDGTGLSAYIEVDPQALRNATLVSIKFIGTGEAPTGEGVEC